MKRLYAVAGLLILAMLAVVLWTPAQAQAQSEDEAVVIAVLFYSPQCPHCEYFIRNDYPLMQEEFGSQLQVLFVNTMSAGGQQLALSAYEVFAVPPDRRAVPMMIIGDNVLVGGIEIPQLGPGIIREGLKNGGIGLPDIPGLQEAYDEAVARAEEEEQNPSSDTGEAAAEQAAGESAAPPNPGPETPSVTEQDTLGSRLARDPVGNGLAIAVLAGLVASVGLVVAGSREPAHAAPARRAHRASRETHKTRGVRLAGFTSWLATVLVGLVGLGVAITLIARAGGDMLAVVLAAASSAMLAALVAAALATGLQQRGAGKAPSAPTWLIPLAGLAGLAAAIYLASVEVGGQEAACGIVGDCNAVQQSPYALLFGVLPIGVLGLVGYAAILVAWMVGWLGSGKLADLAHAALLLMALFGVLFSIYLTFLEPFVIGATCAWCLTSALTMLLILWLIAAPGWRALKRLGSAA